MTRRREAPRSLSHRLVLLAGVLVLAGVGGPTPSVASGLPTAAPRALVADLVPTDVVVDLCAKPGTVPLAGGGTATIWGLAEGSCEVAGDPTLPGPTIESVVGSNVTVNLHNGLAERVSLLFPGQSLVPDTVGAAPGGTRTYEFVTDRSGTFQYASGVRPGIQIPMGLYGGMIVRPIEEGRAYEDGGTQYDVEALLVLSEIDAELNAGPDTFRPVDYDPDHWLINGESYPDTDVIEASPGDRIIIRYVSAGLHNHTITLLGLYQRLIGRDGFRLSHDMEVVAETHAAGSTAEAIVVIPGDAPVGTRYALYSRQLAITNVDSFPGGMLTFIEVVSP